jgi:excisionase family DNA binding protein
MRHLVQSQYRAPVFMQLRGHNEGRKSTSVGTAWAEGFTQPPFARLCAHLLVMSAPRTTIQLGRGPSLSRRTAVTTPQAPRPPRRWAGRKGTAEHLGVSERTVTQMVSDGRITAYRLGGTIRFDLNEIDAAMTPTGGAV